MGRRENRECESEAPPLRGYPPLVFCPGKLSACFCLQQPLPEAVRLAKNFNDVSLVREPVQQCGGHALFPKNRIPVTETKVGRHNDGSSFIEIRTELKQELRTFFGKRNEP